MKYLRKLGQLLQERIPARCRIYFIYTHKNGYDRFYNGLKANTEISYWCFKALSHQFPSVRFLRCQGEKPARVAEIRPQDIVVGHIGPTFSEAARFTKRLIAFNPWAGNEDRSCSSFNCAPHESEMHQFNQCASLVLLTSEYNKREYVDKNRNFWHPYFHNLCKTKSVRFVHQPIDLSLFPRIKFSYATNDFLYIGNDAHMKCVGESQKLVSALGRKLTMYGMEKKLDNLNASQVASLASQADFFIQPGMWEAQCVSILEAAARGFIPVVSEETGYPYSHPYLLRYNDFGYNLQVLKDLLQLGGEERKKLADDLHRQLVTDIHHNNWQKLTDVLVEEVQTLYQNNFII